MILILLTLLPVWQTDHWWVRLWDYPRLQIAALLMVVVALWLVVGPRRGRSFWAGLAAFVAALAWQSTHFIAYFPPWPKQVADAAACPPGRSLELLNSNVLLGNRHYGDLLGLIQGTDPDVILLLEADEGWRRALQPLAARYPFRLAEPVPNTYGMILLSRLPLSGRILHRLQPGVPSIRALLKLPDGELIAFHGLHPEPPFPGDDSGERDAELISVGREVRAEGRAAIVLGDLNDVAWSRTSRLFRHVAGMNDPRVGRGLYPTFNAKYPLLRWPLDHVFVTPHFRLQYIAVEDSIGSDHFPILYRLCLAAPAGERLVAGRAPREVREDARTEVRQGRAEAREERNGN